MSKEMFSGHFFLTSGWRKKCRLWFETRIISKKTLKKNLKIIWSYLELSGIKWNYKNYLELSGIPWKIIIFSDICEFVLLFCILPLPGFSPY